MKKLLFAKPDLCTGCNRCSYACSAAKEGVYRPSRSRVHINNYALEGCSAPSVCFQCPGASCLKACPAIAISRNEDDVVVVDAEKCTGCGDCVSACPYGMIELNDDSCAYKCDTCDGDPVCVKECQPGALVFQEKSPEIVKIKALQMKQRSTTGTAREKRQKLGSAVMQAALETRG